MKLNTGLPIENILDELQECLENNTSAVVCAAPGAGKSTVVPPALLDAPFLAGKKILMLEPRRIAAVGAAKRIAHLLHETVGERAGFRTRYNTKVSGKTRIEVITEGILTRMIQNDPELSDVGLIIFDEFHERSLQADLGLVLALDVRGAFREDLRIMIMSATVDTVKMQKILGRNTPVISSDGKMFPVETLYRPPEDKNKPLEKNLVSNIVFALNHYPGDILVFLPGEGEIRRSLAELEKSFLSAEEQKLLFLPLYGNLPEKEQDLALSPAPDGFRKVILSTPVAESSVTVPGVRIVIDSGWMRVPRFSPLTAMNHLETVRVSVASADQRRGRAGRTANGVCIRLWSQPEENTFPPFNIPEIMEADLASTALELAKWGVVPQTAGELQWPDPPPSVKLEQAFSLLKDLSALDPSGHLTAHGEILLQRPMHPRLAHMVTFAEKIGKAGLGAALGALLSERDFLRNQQNADLKERLRLLMEFQSADKMNFPVDRAAFQRVRTALRQLSGESFNENDLELCGILTAAAYPDRIARCKVRHSGEFILANGVTARLQNNDDLSQFEYLCIPAVDGMGKTPCITLAAELTIEQIRQYFSEQIKEIVTAQWDNSSRALSVWKEERFGSIALTRKSMPLQTPELDPAIRSETLLNGIRRLSLPWSKNEESLMERISFLYKHLGGEWPDLSQENLAATLSDWLAPFLTEKHNSYESLRGETLAAAFRSLIGYDKLMQLESLAPEKIEVPSGSKIRVDYSHDPPLLPVRLQEVFGMTQTPKLAGGKVPLVMNLLSPAMRTVQITSDLAHFWANSYFQVRKDMRGRYPKHDWPENPLETPAHRGVKRPAGKIE
ncbi:MAG: ATP-dependent helicase HrpB [Lentisphaeria bacterium]|nr:ATP-dependent helicase HrpB [Lentisphaeria bacterium]